MPSHIPPLCHSSWCDLLQNSVQMIDRSMRFLLDVNGWEEPSSGAYNPYWFQTRERLLNGILGAGTVLGTLALLVSTGPLLKNGIESLLIIPLLILGLAWVLSLARVLTYRLRSGALVASVYALGLNEILHVGYSEDVHAFLIAFSLLALLFFGPRLGLATIALSVATLALVGWAIVAELFVPFAGALRVISASTVLTTCLNFVLLIGTIQVGMIVLLQSLHLGWQREDEARAMLEQRVAERTRELAEARDQEAAQKAYLAVLHDTTLDLLNHHATEELFQMIVERTAVILDAPYCELMLCEGDELVVRATTANQAFLRGERVSRQEARLSWRAFDSQQPVALDDYSAWSQHRAVYNQLAVRAIADFPIVVGQESRGVLALGRNLPGYTFSEEALDRGVMLARLVALVLEHARLYKTALKEIDERIEAEAALQCFADELQAQNNDLDSFAHTVAHDLKIPLTSVIGYSQLLLSGLHDDPDQSQELLETISSTARKMNAIINDLLLLARVRTLESIPITDVPMGRVVVEAQARLRDMITEAQATIVVPERWPGVIGYAPWVEEVWVNYLSNAIKYGGQPPLIELGADMLDDRQVRFWVQDNGPGLSDEQRAQIFTPFTRFHTGRVSGHGLGLSIVDRIVTKLGGYVSVESAPGRGARFCFTLPTEHPALLAERTV